MTADVAIPVAGSPISRALLDDVPGHVTASLVAAEPGVIAGLDGLSALEGTPGLGTWDVRVAEGRRVSAGDVLARLRGAAGDVLAATDHLMGPVGYASGVATRCAALAASAPPGLRLVCGAWKKLPVAMKPLLRAGLAAGGVHPRLLDGEFVYVDKVAVALLGGVADAVRRGRSIGAGGVAVQVQTVDEAIRAATLGAVALMVDTGSIAGLARTSDALVAEGLRGDVLLAFGGGAGPEALLEIHAAGADIVDMGRAVLNAPLLDLRIVAGQIG